MAHGKAPAVCVAGILIRDGTALLVHRSPLERAYPNVWDLFGGHVEDGESEEEALRREAREELGIELLAWEWLDQAYDPAVPAIVHVYAVLAWNGEPINAAPEEHTDLRWFGVNELPKSEALDAYRALVENALS